MTKIFDIQAKHSEDELESIRKSLTKCTPFFRHFMSSQHFIFLIYFKTQHYRNNKSYK